MARDVRKTVTVLFCDVVASSTLGVLLDPEAVRRMIGRFFSEMGDVVERHGGTVEKFIGDEVMAVFGVPSVHEDDALRAVRAAAAMRDRLADLNRELEAGWGARLDVRIGVNTGEVVAGDPSAGHGFLTGDAVVVAKRLESAAEPGAIALGETTYRLVRHAVDATSVGPVTAKGDRQLALYRLNGVQADAPVVARRLDIPLVGRDRELDELRRAYDLAVREKRAHLVSVLGPAGIGKSRLVHELIATVGDEATALVGRCLAYGDGITFWPVREILRQAGEAEGAFAGTTDEIFRRTRLVLERAAQERPVIACFEDLHWAEPTLIDLVEYLAGWTRAAPMLLVCLARPEFLEARPEWLSPRPNATTITLAPLAQAEADVLLDVLAAPAAARPAIARAAEGNPLYVEQMAAMAAETGASTIETPPSIRALLAERLDRLPPGERAVAQHAAVLGRDFPPAGVAAVAAPELAADVRSHLLALARKDLVEPDPASEDGFRFRHALIRDAAYDAMPKQLRAELHERAGEWGSTARADDVIIGVHLEHAYRYREQLGRVDEHARMLAVQAAEMLGDAGRRAFAREDMPAALKLLDRAVALMNESDPARLELTRELSTALWVVGELARAEALLNGLVEAAAAAGDRRIEWYALLERAAREALTGQGDLDELLRVSETAVTVFEEIGDTLGLARAWRRIAYAHRTRCRFGEAEAASERAYRYAVDAGNAQEASRSVDELCTNLLYGPAHAADAIERSEALLDGARGNLLMEANILTSLAGLLGLRGEFDPARALCARAAAIYDDLGLRLPVAGLTRISGPLELLADNPVAAERELRRGYEILAEAAGRRLLADQAALLGEALCEQGRHDEAETLRAETEAGEPQDLASRVLRLRLRARLDAAAGNPHDALDHARRAVQLASATDALTLHGDAALLLATLSADAGRTDEAAAAAAEAVELYRRKGNLVGARRAEMLSAIPR